jgi:hypothetical protein
MYWFHLWVLGRLAITFVNVCASFNLVFDVYKSGELLVHKMLQNISLTKPEPCYIYFLPFYWCTQAHVDDKKRTLILFIEKGKKVTKDVHMMLLVISSPWCSRHTTYSHSTVSPSPLPWFTKHPWDAIITPASPQHVPSWAWLLRTYLY